MSNVRRIWHFKPQNALHQGMLNPTIASFFAILLQCYSKIRITLQQYSKKKKLSLKKKKFIQPFSPEISLPSISLLKFSFLSSFSVSPSTLSFSGSVVFFFFFFCCDRCLKEDHQCLGWRFDGFGGDWRGSRRSVMVWYGSLWWLLVFFFLL